MYFIIEDSLSIREVGQVGLSHPGDEPGDQAQICKANANADALSRNPAAVSSCAMVEASTDSSVDNSSHSRRIPRMGVISVTLSFLLMLLSSMRFSLLSLKIQHWQQSADTSNMDCCLQT